MGVFENAFKRELGKNTAKTASNLLFGDKWSTPYRRTDGRAEAAKTRAEARANIDNARADHIYRSGLNAVDAAVLRNVDAVIGSEIGETPAEMVKSLSGLCIQLEANSFSQSSKEDKIRAKYTNAVYIKMRLGIRQLEYADPLNPHLDEFISAYYKARRKKTRAALPWWLVIIIGMADFFSFCFLADEAGELPAMVLVLGVNLALVILFFLCQFIGTCFGKLFHRIRRKRIYMSMVNEDEALRSTTPISAPVSTPVNQPLSNPVQQVSQPASVSSSNHYRKEFVDLMNDPRWEGAYIGQGNPNARILIVGREHGFDGPEQRSIEIEKNWSQWKRILEGDESSEQAYSPRHCYAERGQQFRIAPTTGGTSPTWYVYQKIVNALIPHGLIMRELDFFEYSFITEFSAVNRPNNDSNTDADIQATADSIAERTPLLSSAFYRSFPVVILSCGNYFDRYHINIEKMFDVKWEGRTREVTLGNGKKAWLNMHYSADGKRTVIHTWQASAFTHGADAQFQPFFDKLVEVAGSFA